MARRTLVDIDNKILDATIAIGAEIGAENVTAQKVASRCDISHFTCFEHFETKNNMVSKAYDKAISWLSISLRERLGEEFSLESLWNAAFSLLMEEKEKTLFVYSYAHGNCAAISEKIVFYVNGSTLLATLPGWTEWSDAKKAIWLQSGLLQTFHFASLLITGSLVDSEENRAEIRKCVLAGLSF